MNGPLFLLHIFAVLFFVLGALRLGKEALIALISLFAVLANLFVMKQIDLFGLEVTCSDVFAIGAILGLNLLQEYFGKEAAKIAIRISFGALIFFGAMVMIHLAYLPSSHDSTQSAYATIFSHTPRIVGASFFVYYIVQKWDLYFFQWLQKRFDNRRLGIRLLFSLLVSQALDTVLFSFLGLYGIVDSVFDIIVMSFAIKCAIIALSSPIAAFSKRWVRA